MTEPVHQIMSKKLVSLQLTDSVRKAYQVMHERNIRHLPVVDRTGNIIGILSDRDLKMAMTITQEALLGDESMIEFDPDLKVESFMSWPVKSISLDASIYEATQVMLKNKISAILVVDDHQRIKGIVTTDDLLKLLLKLLEKNPSSYSQNLESFVDDLTQSFYLS